MMGKVLILDQRSSWSRFAVRTLSACGYDPIIVEDREESLALLEEAARKGEEYSLIIVDPLYGRTEEDPTVESLEVAKTIAECFPKVPLIVASSRPTPDEAVVAYRIGALAYTPKTFDENQLLALVKEVVDKAKSRNS